MTITRAPETSTALLAEEVARRYYSPALYHHCARSYAWGAAYAKERGLVHDDELLYVAAMLHDLGLTPLFDSHERAFEEASGQVAWVFGAGAGWPETRRTRLAEVIERHMWPAVNPDEDTEGHILEVATGIDISGRGVDMFPAALQSGVVAAWPRLGLTDEFSRCFRNQADRKPSTRAASVSLGGLEAIMRANPLERD